MIKRAYIIKNDCEVGKRAIALFKREKLGKSLFQRKAEFEAELETDWDTWKTEACTYIYHIYGDYINGNIFTMSLHNGDILVEQHDRHYVNVKQER